MPKTGARRKPGRRHKAFSRRRKIRKPNVAAGWKVETVLMHPNIANPSCVCTLPDGRILVAEDPMNNYGHNGPGDRILCIFPDGHVTEFANHLFGVYGLAYLDGKVYVHHMPRFTVFKDDNGVGKDPVELFRVRHAGPRLRRPRLLRLVRVGLHQRRLHAAPGRRAGSRRRAHLHDPLVVIGGAVTFVNPEPLAPFADVIAAGEGEVLDPRADAAIGEASDRDDLCGASPRSAASTSRRSTTSATRPTGPSPPSSRSPAPARPRRAARRP